MASPPENSSSWQEEVSEEEPEPKRLWTKGLVAIIAILILLLLLALFLPVKKEKESPKAKELPKPSGAGVVGRTRYIIISAKKTFSIGDARPSTKGAFLVVTFKVENLYPKSRALDFSMVRLIDRQRHPIIPLSDVTLTLYEISKKNAPWEENIPPRIPTTVQVVFSVAKSEAGERLNFSGRDFNWTSSDAIELPLKVEGEARRERKGR